MKKIKISLSAILFILSIGCLLCGFNTAAQAKQNAVKYTIRLASPGMTQEQVLQAVGQPTFKAKKGNSWNYRKKPGAPANLSDPQILFKNGLAKIIVGSQLEANGKTVLKSGDSEAKIAEVLGKADRIEAGVGKDVRIHYYDKLVLQIVVHKGNIAVMRFN